MLPFVLDLRGAVGSKALVELTPLQPATSWGSVSIVYGDVINVNDRAHFDLMDMNGPKDPLRQFFLRLRLHHERHVHRDGGHETDLYHKPNKTHIARESITRPPIIRPPNSTVQVAGKDGGTQQSVSSYFSQI